MKVWDKGIFRQDSPLSGIYKAKGNWVEIDDMKDVDILQERAERGVLVEAGELLQCGISKCDLFHSTGSEALKGMAVNSAILASEEARKRGILVGTGEYATSIGPVDSQKKPGEKRGASSIYASESSALNWGYAQVRWFDEYPVTLGMEQAEIIPLARSQGEKTTLEEIRLGYHRVEGIQIGREIPLKMIKLVIAPVMVSGQMRKWVGENCSQAQFATKEAVDLIDRYKPGEIESFLKERKPVEID